MGLLEKIYQFFVLFSYKSQHNPLSSPFPGIYPREREGQVYGKTCISTLTAGLVATAHQVMDQQLWYMHAMEYSPANAVQCG